MEKVIIVQTTFSNKNEAARFGKKILEARLAACVQISPDVDSLYWWKDAIEEDKEIIVSMKTLDILYPRLEEYIEENHSYETPEILATVIDYVANGYYQWLKSELAKVL